MEERHAEQKSAPRRGLERQIAPPGLVHLVGVGMENELRRAGSAAGVEVGGDIAGGDFSAADQAVRRLLADQRLKGVDGIRLVAGPIDLDDRFQLLQFARVL